MISTQTVCALGLLRCTKQFSPGSSVEWMRQETSKFEESLDKIKEALGVDDADTLVESFIVPISLLSLLRFQFSLFFFYPPG